MQLITNGRVKTREREWRKQANTTLHFIFLGKTEGREAYEERGYKMQGITNGKVKLRDI